MRREKLNTQVNIPLSIDLSRFAPYSSKTFFKLGIEHESKSDALYSLYAISHHSGTLTRGHYIAEVLNPSDNKWY